MTRQRLTREQSREQTRARLLDAAQAVFTKLGFAAASIEDIVGAAGYTRGAFYPNFRSKTELLFELIRRDHEQLCVDLQRIFEQESSPEEMQRQILAYYSQVYRDNKCFLIRMDAKLKASRDARFRSRCNELARELRQQLTAFISACFERIGTAPPMPPETLAVGLMALCDGVQFMYTSDPQGCSDELAESVLAGFLGAVMFGNGGAR